MSTSIIARCPRLAAAALAAAALSVAAMGAGAQSARAFGCANADAAVVNTRASGDLSASDNRAEVRQAMVCLINQQRTASGIRPLAVQVHLTKGAQSVASTVRGTAISFAGQPARVSAYCSGAPSCTFYEYGIVIENGTARRAVTTLLGSAAVKKVLLSPSLTEIGAGAEATWWSTGPSFSDTHFGGAFALELGRRG
jgi:hypothetical protein